MSDSTPIPDDVPFADAAEQRQPAADLITDDGADAPLEADSGDWQEQHQLVVDPDADDERR
jgi:hypothetical protein